MKIIFFGTPQFAAQTLQFLFENQCEVVAVVTRPDKPQGRSGTPIATPVKTVALSQSKSIDIYQPEKASDPEFAEILKKYQPDLFVVVAYGEIIKQFLLDIPTLGCINVHASLLPKYRGAAPIQHAIINGEVETGVTIMHMVRQMDAGDIIKMAKIEIDPDTTTGELTQNLCTIGSKALLEVIHDFENGKFYREPQDHSKATLAPKIELIDCEIKWNLSATVIHNKIRASNPEPGAWCHVLVRGEKKRLKIFKSKVLESVRLNPGKISFESGLFAVGCGEGTVALLEVQLEGKKRVTAEEFMRGFSKEALAFIT